MAYSGPWTGRLTDVRNFCQDQDAERKKYCPEEYITNFDFEHGQDEAFASDGIYKANLHCIVPYETEKLTDAEFDLLSVAQQRRIREEQLWNKVFSYRRARIERRFGQLDRHRFFHYTLRSIPMIALLYRAMWNAEIIKQEIEASPSPNYADELLPGKRVVRHFGDACTCAFDGMWYSGHPKRTQFLAHRDDLRRAYVTTNGMSVREGRPSRHESKADTMERALEMPLTQVAGLTEPRLFF